MDKLSNIKIGFFGTPDFSLQFLKYLFNENFLIKFVVSQPASKSGRGKKLNYLLLKNGVWKTKYPFLPLKTLMIKNFLK